MTVQGRVVVWTFLVIAVMGCRTPKETEPIVRPTARVLSVQMQDVQIDYATLTLEVELANSLTRKVSVIGSDCWLTSGPNLFRSATSVSNVTVAPKGTQVLTLQDTIVYERLLRALDARVDSTIPFRLELRLLLKTGRGRTVKVPARGEGQLFLPPLPPTGAADGVAKPLDVIYIATPRDVVEKMLSMARLRREDLVYDLGCGDGRVLVTAARKYGCRAAGYDLDPRRVQESRENAKRAGVEHLIGVEQKDIFDVDLEPADVVFIYLNPVVNRRLIPRLRTLRPGSRIVSHSFPIGDIKPDEVATMISREDGREHYVYLWTAPLKTDSSPE